MKVYQGTNSFPQLSHAVLTTGTFDGVHLGHKKIIEKLVDLAQEKGGETVLFTFHPHPRMVLFPNDHGLQLLNTREEKVKLLQESGIDHLVFYPFTEDFSRLSATEYVRDLLVNKLHVGTLVVGYDHHFGRNREGNFQLLADFGEIYDFKLEQISALDVDEVNVSSTKIRRALNEGDVQTANSYLGYPYLLNGTVEKGQGLGHGIGFPTANIRIDDGTKLIPANGVYAIEASIEDKPHRGMLNIGVRPTVSSRNLRSIEAHLFDFEDNIYDQEIEVRLLQRLRDEQTFASVEQLSEQLAKDKHNALRWLEAHS